MEALHNLGIDGKLLLAQVINFLILLFILRRFAYRPTLAFLESRTARIEQGIKDADSAREKLVEIEKKERETLALAQQEARDIITGAEAAAKKRSEAHEKSTSEKAKKFLEDARIEIEEEKRKSLSEIQNEVASLIALSTEKVLREKSDSEKGPATRFLD